MAIATAVQAMRATIITAITAMAITMIAEIATGMTEPVAADRRAFLK